MATATPQHQISLVNEADAARRLKVSTLTMWRMRRDGLIPFVRIGNSIRYRDDVIDRLVREGTPRRAGSAK